MQSTAFYRWMGVGAILIALLGVVRIATHSNSSSNSAGNPSSTSSTPTPGTHHHHHHHGSGTGIGATPTPQASSSTASAHQQHHHATATTSPSAPATTVATSTQPSTGGGGSTSTPTPTPTHSTSSGTGGGSSIVIPAYGSYPYATSGSESAAGQTRNYPSSSKITLAKDGSCVSSTWQPISQHKEVQVVCPDGSTAVRLKSESQTITFFGIGASQDLTCNSAAILYSTALKAGDTWSFVCKSAQTKAASKATVIGFQTFSIGGKSIKALHVHVVATISGSGTGTSTQDYWYAPSLGTLVKIQAKTNVKEQSVSYSGHDTLVLSSTKPS
jgi:hypothetical protein